MQFLLDVWSAVLAEMKKDYSENLMELWFNELKLVQLTDDTAIIATKQKFKRDFLESRYSKIIESYLEKVLGFSVNVIFLSTEDKSLSEQLSTMNLFPEQKNDDMVSSSESPSSDNQNFEHQNIISNKINSSEHSDKTVSITHDFLETDFKAGINNLSDIYSSVCSSNNTSSDNIKDTLSENENRQFSNKSDPGYSFSNFIVGDSNKFAHAACLAVANSFSENEKKQENGYFQKQYNPLFIHGPSGLGKTHLLYSVMNHINKINPNAKIVYVKGEDFTNQLIDSISHNTNEQFRNKYRKADVLLIDDIQFIAGKVSTQEEFFHTFNALYEKNKQIILTSDCPPRDIKTLEDRLKTRFEWGLIADIQPPGFELRIAIMKSKAEALGIELPADVLEFLAENLKNNVRQLEGAVKKLGARSFLTGAKITVDLAVSCVADLLTGSEPVSVTVDRIFEKVSKKYGISIEDIKSRKRTKGIASARHITIYIIRKMTDLSLPAIGRLLGRDHTTIMSSIETIENEMMQNTLFEIEINELMKEIKE